MSSNALDAEHARIFSSVFRQIEAWVRYHARSADHETQDAIRDKIIDKLVASGELNKILAQQGVSKYWLCRVVKNYVIDYLRSAASDKRAPEQALRAATVSLSDAVYGASQKTYVDCVATPHPFVSPQEGTNAQLIKRFIAVLEAAGLDWKYHITLKLYLICHDDPDDILTPEDYRRIAQARNISVERLIWDVHRIRERHFADIENNIKRNGTMMQCHEVIMRSYRMLESLERRGIPPGHPEVVRLRKKLAREEQRFSKLSKKTQKKIVLSRDEIASVLGETESTVNNWLARALRALLADPAVLKRSTKGVADEVW